MMSRTRLLVPAIGLGAGAASSFLGIGGGAIIVPLLMIALGLPFKEAVGTSLAAVVLISTANGSPEMKEAAAKHHSLRDAYRRKAS